MMYIMERVSIYLQMENGNNHIVYIERFEGKMLDGKKNGMG